MRTGTAVLVVFFIAAHVVTACQEEGAEADRPPTLGEVLGVDPDEELDTVAERLGIDPATDAFDGGGAGLRAAASCEDLPALYRQALTEAMRAQVLAHRRAALGADCSSPVGSSSAFSCGFRSSSGAPSGVPVDVGDEVSSKSSVEGAAGVEEPDFVKTDGEHLYIVRGSALTIVRAWPAEAAEVVSTVELDGSPQALFVHGDRLVVYSYDPSMTCYDEYNYDGADCRSGDTTTLVSVLDISSRSAPRLLRQIELRGAYVSSRRVGRSIYSVASFEPTVSGLQFAPDLAACDAESAEELDGAYGALLARNERLIMEAPASSLLPSAVERRFGPDGRTVVAEEDLLGDCTGLMIPRVVAGLSTLSILAFDLDGDAGATMTSVLGDQGVVSADEGSLYLATSYNVGAGEGLEVTAVHRFSLWSEPAEVLYEASGIVGGRVLNQFSLDEYGGYLRIATTTGTVPGSVFNAVSVLEQDGNGLVVVGEVSPIGRSEDIRAVRFVGDRGYVVTFEKTDPLFVLDLSRPRAPRLRGELVVPGFSTFLHVLDEDHLLSVGYDADDVGSFSWFQGIQLQIFDVSDMDAPRRLHYLVLGDRGSASAAALSHLAWSYSEERGLLALPVRICEGGAGGSDFGDRVAFDGLAVYEVDEDLGFVERGRLSQPGEGGCGGWWTDASSTVERGLFLGDFVYSLSRDELLVGRLDDLSAPVARVAIPASGEDR